MVLFFFPTHFYDIFVYERILRNCLNMKDEKPYDYMITGLAVTALLFANFLTGTLKTMSTFHLDLIMKYNLSLYLKIIIVLMVIFFVHKVRFVVEVNNILKNMKDSYNSNLPTSVFERLKILNVLNGMFFCALLFGGLTVGDMLTLCIELAFWRLNFSLLFIYYFIYNEITKAEILKSDTQKLSSEKLPTSNKA